MRELPTDEDNRSPYLPSCRAQNKYREKQKQKMKDTEAAVEEVSVELERLRLENERMRASRATMESVLAVREQAVGMLTAAAAEQVRHGRCSCLCVYVCLEASWGGCGATGLPLT